MMARLTSKLPKGVSGNETSWASSEKISQPPAGRQTSGEWMPEPSVWRS
jgi:hypothetical protein